MKCCELTAGMLRHRIELQEPVKTPDGGGGWTVEWQTYATVRAYLRPLSGGERLQAERLEATTRHRGFMRYRDDVLESHRVKFRGRVYQIRAALDLEFRRKWLELDLEGGVAT